jgi:hypothetical protein
MNIYVFNKELEQLGVIDNYESLIWKRKSSELGSFELHCDFNEDTKYLIKEGNIICKSDNLTECAYIKDIYIDRDSNDMIKATGYFILGYISQRIVWNTLNINDTVENAIYKLVDSNCINTNENRKIPFLKVSNSKGYNEKISIQVSYKNVLEKIESICLENDLNIRILTDLINKQHTFEVYKGIDRTVNQSENSICIFSKEFGNILQQSYTLESNNLKNTALVGGEGEGLDRVLITIGDDFSGLDRYEIFIDADDIRTENDDGIISYDEYIKQVRQRGLERLSECQKISTFTSEINATDSNLEYRKDFDLGDIVTCINKDWDIIINTKITEIEEVYENNTLEISITFGNKIPTIIDKIRQVKS